MEGVLLAGATVDGTPAASTARHARATAPAQRRASTDVAGVAGAALGTFAVVLLLAVGAWGELGRLPAARSVARRLLPHRGDR